MRVVENHRLKIAGLVIGGAGVGVFAWLGARSLEFMTGLRSPTLFLGLILFGVNLTAVGLLLLSAGCGLRTSWHNPRRRHAILLQVLLANILTPAVAYGVLAQNDDIDKGFETSGWALSFEIACTVVLVIAWRLWRRAQKYEAPDADEAMAADQRPPVLYLRSFQDDGDAMVGPYRGFGMRQFTRLVGVRTAEQELTDILDHLGPVIAIGKPGEPLPELGAARLYVSHEMWQAKVLALMQQASLIVVRIGASAGVLWEIERALDVPREKIALLLVGDAAPPLELMARLAPVLGKELTGFLPDNDEGWRRWMFRDPRRRIGSLVCFPRGVPRSVPLTLWPFWGRDALTIVSFRPSALPLRRAWRTAFTLLEHEAGLMADRPSRAIAVMLALVVGWTGAHWLYLGHRRRAVAYLLMLVLVPMFLGFYDALRFVLVDRETFDARYVAGASRQR